MEKLLTRDDIFSICQWSASTLHRRIVAGEFPAAIDVGGLPRWRSSEVEDYLASRPRTQLLKRPGRRPGKAAVAEVTTPEVAVDPPAPCVARHNGRST